MTQVSIASLLLALASCSVLAQEATLVVDPEVDYINTPESIRVEWGIRSADSVVRKDIDLNDDGQIAVFLHFSGSGSKCGPDWTAYIPSEGKGYQRIDGVEFREYFLRSGKVPGYNPDGGIIGYYPGKGGGDLVRFRFNGGKLQFDKFQTIHVSNPEDHRVFELIFQRKWDEGMPAEFFKNPPHQVIAVQEIMARSDKTQPSGISKGSTGSISGLATPTAKPSGVDADRSIIKPAAVTPAQNETRNVWPWVIGITLLVIAAQFLFKRRS